LQSVGERLAKLSNDLAVNRPRAIVQQTQDLSEEIAKSSHNLEHLSQTKPFGLLLKQVNTRDGDLLSVEGFAAQAAMLQIYLDTEQYAQAITLAREAIVLKICELEVHQHSGNFKQRRKEAEKILYKQIGEVEHFYTFGRDSKDTLANLWEKIRTLRNDINHAGMLEDAKPSEEAIPEIEEACRKTRAFITS
jgi:hypothetical protein